MLLVIGMDAIVQGKLWQNRVDEFSEVALDGQAAQPALEPTSRRNATDDI